MRKEENGGWGGTGVERVPPAVPGPLGSGTKPPSAGTRARLGRARTDPKGAHGSKDPRAAHRVPRPSPSSPALPPPPPSGSAAAPGRAKAARGWWPPRGSSPAPLPRHRDPTERSPAPAAHCPGRGCGSAPTPPSPVRPVPLAASRYRLGAAGAPQNPPVSPRLRSPGPVGGRGAGSALPVPRYTGAEGGTERGTGTRCRTRAALCARAGEPQSRRTEPARPAPALPGPKAGPPGAAPRRSGGGRRWRAAEAPTGRPRPAVPSTWCASCSSRRCWRGS